MAHEIDFTQVLLSSRTSSARHVIPVFGLAYFRQLSLPHLGSPEKTETLDQQCDNARQETVERRRASRPHSKDLHRREACSAYESCEITDTNSLYGMEKWADRAHHFSSNCSLKLSSSLWGKSMERTRCRNLSEQHAERWRRKARRDGHRSRPPRNVSPPTVGYRKRWKY
jgi:hypothetical protein